MPKEQRQRLLSQAQRRQILALPTDPEEIAKRFTLSRADIELIRRHRSDSNRLGYALQLLYVQKLGRVWMPDSETPTEIVESISKQLGVQSWKLQDYANRDETRREHLSDLMDSFGWITMPHKGYLNLSPWLLEIAMGSDHGMHLMRELLSELRRRRILMPAIGVLERFVSASNPNPCARKSMKLSMSLNVGMEPMDLFSLVRAVKSPPTGLKIRKSQSYRCTCFRYAWST